MYLDPEPMTLEHRRRIDRWMVANGCRDHIALDPIIVRGKVAEYTAAGRRDGSGMRDHMGNPVHHYRRKRLRIRIPLSRIA